MKIITLQVHETGALPCMLHVRLGMSAFWKIPCKTSPGFSNFVFTPHAVGVQPDTAQPRCTEAVRLEDDDSEEDSIS